MHRASALFRTLLSYSSCPICLVNCSRASGLALAHLVQDGGDAVQALQLSVHVAQAGVLLAEADVQVGAADLGDAVHQDALAHPDVALGVIAVAARGVEAGLVQPLAGVARGVEILLPVTVRPV